MKIRTLVMYACVIGIFSPANAASGLSAKIIDSAGNQFELHNIEFSCPDLYGGWKRPPDSISEHEAPLLYRPDGNRASFVVKWRVHLLSAERLISAKPTAMKVLGQRMGLSQWAKSGRIWNRLCLRKPCVCLASPNILSSPPQPATLIFGSSVSKVILNESIRSQ